MGLCLPPSLSKETLQGFKYFRLLGPLFDHLHRAATERDRARESAVVLRSVCQLAVAVLFQSNGDQLTRSATDHDVGECPTTLARPPDLPRVAQ